MGGTSLNAVFFGDNLHVLRALPSNTIDLIYIDPPFFSGRNYNQIWGDDNEIRTFHDIWEDGLPSYLVWLNARLWEMRRILKETGSIYVHCDWHASHYIKCEMDKIFGYGYGEGDKPIAGFRRQLIWSLGNRGGNVGHYPKNHEVILYYTKSDKSFVFNVQKKGYSEKLKRTFKQDENGRWYYTRGSRTGRRKLADWEIESQIGKRTYVDPDNPNSGTKINDLWDEDEIAGYPTGNEKIGYPTQKPYTLLERIILASSNEGDVVADFFMGGGTTCAVAQKLNRRFIGCDISRVASSVTLNRLIKDAEDISGRTASLNLNKPKKESQGTLELTIKEVPNIHVYYMGVYPIEKFEFIDQKQFEDFILTCYEARRFTGEGNITGVMNAATSILIGSVRPHESIGEQQLKDFVEDTLKLRYQPNVKMKLKV